MTSPKIAFQRANWYPKDTYDHNAGYLSDKSVVAYEGEPIWPKKQTQGFRSYVDVEGKRHDFEHSNDGGITGDSESICSEDLEVWSQSWNTKFDQYGTREVGICFDRTPIPDDWFKLSGPLNFDCVGICFEWSNQGSYWGDSHISIYKIGLHYWDLNEQKPLFYKAELDFYWGESPETQKAANNDRRRGCLYKIPDKYHNDIWSKNIIMVGATICIKTHAYKSAAHTRKRNIYRMIPYAYAPDTHDDCKLVRTAPVENLLSFGQGSRRVNMQVYGGVQNMSIRDRLNGLRGPSATDS